MNKYQYILQHKKEILQKTENSSISIRNNFVIYEVINGNSLDKYFFERNDSELELLNHLRNDKNDFDELDTIAICKTVSKQLDYIKKFQINAYTQEFKEFGVPMKFYLDDYEQILYIPNPDSLQGTYRNYVTKSKLLDKDWYLYKEE